MCLVTHEMSDTSSVENLALWERRRKCRCVQCPLYLWWLHVSTTRDWMCPRFSILLTLELLCYLPTIYLFDNFNIIFTTSRKLFANCEKLFLFSKIASSTWTLMWSRSCTKRWVTLPIQFPPGCFHYLRCTSSSFNRI